MAQIGSLKIDDSSLFHDTTPAHAAAFSGNHVMLATLANRDPKLLWSRTSDGETAAHHAAAAGQVTALAFFADWDVALLTYPDNDGWNSAHHAAFYNHLDCLKVISERAPEALGAKDSTGRFPADLSSNESCKQFLVATRDMTVKNTVFDSPPPKTRRHEEDVASAASAASTPVKVASSSVPTRTSPKRVLPLKASPPRATPGGTDPETKDGDTKVDSSNDFVPLSSFSLSGSTTKALQSIMKLPGSVGKAAYVFLSGRVIILLCLAFVALATWSLVGDQILEAVQGNPVSAPAWKLPMSASAW
eukprot:CAMPEP_0181296832 /NCGR_PEP_ID=MMETSP1101-20121128/4913_1 /TAXON_ID=46948 /ORGANISM="Rhodomonas abbreviata, Strain Caron Lab Isolate" /LENGTH=303 /DNA_ID=CAMNT_0023401721 /DNA_START=52 /DNA_END=960 /DNA_ORIENTATION=-